MKLLLPVALFLTTNTMAGRLAKDPEQMGPKEESLVNKIQLDPKQQDILNRLSAIESSSGQNLNHPEVTEGVQAGDTAVGQYGLMPNTIKEFSERMIREGNAPLAVQRVNNTEDPQAGAEQVARDPELEQLYAKNMLQHILKNQNGNEDATAYSWTNGHNLKANAITPEKLDKSSYVQKFRRLKSKVYGNR